MCNIFVEKREMDRSLSMKTSADIPYYRLPAGPVIGLLLTLLLALAIWAIAFRRAAPSLTETLEKKLGIAASPQMYEAAILQATADLAAALNINLDDYDITLEQYEALSQAAMEKFGACEQYKLYAVKTHHYPCFTCLSRRQVILISGQVFKIGQTCGDQYTRYGESLQQDGLFYLVEFRGNIFEVLVAEYLKLVLFRYSKERTEIIHHNQLLEEEMPLPPGNKIMR
jgi:hypothetical protein